jgi:hypothetical protein
MCGVAPFPQERSPRPPASRLRRFDALLPAQSALKPNIVGCSVHAALRSVAALAAGSALLSWSTVLVSASGCGTSCAEVSADCAPLYQPTFDELFDRTLLPTCSASGSSCHSAAGAQGGLVLDEREAAYTALLDGRVDPGDAGCSDMVVRLESSDVDEQMPPGSPLSAQERCAIVQWIASGAAR